MKNKILITIIFLTLKLNAQCVRQISTNPVQSVNSADELKLNNASTTNYSPLNTFNWKSQYIPNSTYTLADIEYITQKNPLQSAFFMSPFNYTVTNVDYLFLANGFDSDNKSADGWELLKVEFGIQGNANINNDPNFLPNKPTNYTKTHYA
jgi:hypothetical protein